MRLDHALVAHGGGGIMRCAAFDHVAREDVDEVLVERSGINREASGTNEGNLRRRGDRVAGDRAGAPRCSSG